MSSTRLVMCDVITDVYLMTALVLLRAGVLNMYQRVYRAVAGRNSSDVRPLTEPLAVVSACVPGLHGSRSVSRTIDSPPARCSSSSSSFCFSSTRGSFPSDPARGPCRTLRALQMAGHEWEDWFEREEFIGQISDMRVQNLQGAFGELCSLFVQFPASTAEHTVPE
ncbi:Calmin Calponin-like transmembrane domain protein [Collichthys lucidus]|uniref:Calmin Calponin-like transmembrane domain protein n=1 Tax=Collichthys lucidus TaxID=240159 RepID=A0A4U5VDM6_COLLU|nr:Calmin Calponin-like transmembrane domain protein [Collichthys lucidus]